MKGPVNVNRAAALGEEDKRARGDDVIWTYFRCADLNCNKLFTKEDHALGYCGGCQGVRFIVARYLTPKEDKLIKKGKVTPHQANLAVIGAEPPPPREVR